MSTKQAADQILGFAAARGIPALTQVIEGSSEERALRDLGWISTYQPALVLVSRLADFLAGKHAHPSVHIRESLQPDWEDAYQHSRPNSADPAIVR